MIIAVGVILATTIGASFFAISKGVDQTGSSSSSLSTATSGPDPIESVITVYQNGTTATSTITRTIYEPVTYTTDETVDNTFTRTVVSNFTTTEGTKTVYRNTTSYEVITRTARVNRTITTTSTSYTLAKDLIVWNIGVTFSRGTIGVETVPDEFDYVDDWTANATMIVYYLSVWQFAQMVNCGISCVTGQYSTVSGMEANDVFTGGEGCGGFLAVYEIAPGNTATAAYLRPEVGVTFNGSPVSTCA